VAEPAGLPLIRKLVAVLIALWTVASAAIFWSIHNSPRATIYFFLILAGLPIVMMLGLLMIARYFEKTIPPVERRRRRIKATGRDKKA